VAIKAAAKVAKAIMVKAAMSALTRVTMVVTDSKPLPHSAQQKLRWGAMRNLRWPVAARLCHNAQRRSRNKRLSARLTSLTILTMMMYHSKTYLILKNK
jgi:hypothetical protein